MGSMSAGHWLIVMLIALLVFGPKRLADVGKGLGEGLKNFKKGLSETDEAKGQIAGKEDDTTRRLSPPSQPS
jgi:sec-independent protein translocase protein TatA